MTLVDHLSELRWRLFKALLAIALGGALGFVVSDQAVALLAAPIPGDEPLFFTGLGDAFAIRLKIAFVIGVILAMPVLLYQGWAFIAPGLTATERRATVDPARAVLLRARRVDRLHRAAVRCVVSCSATTPDLQPLITAGSYFEFVTTMFLQRRS